MTAPAERTVRRGLPRRPGGEPWPEPRTGPGAPAAAENVASASASAESRGLSGAPEPSGEPTAARPAAAAPAAAVPAAEPATAAPAAPATATVAPLAAAPVAAPVSSATVGPQMVRRGLPRTPGGEPWPPPREVPTPQAAAAAPEVAPATAAVSDLAPVAEAAPVGAAASEVAPQSVPVAEAAPASVAVAEAEAEAETAPAPPAAPASPPQPAAASAREAHPKTRSRSRVARWAGLGVAAVVAAGAVMLMARGLLSFPAIAGFVAAYPGEYELPAGAPVGFPAWLAWQHFFNVFLMVLIVRSGLEIRSGRRPAAFWTSRRRPGRKISLTLWFHQCLDLLWLVNGAVYVVLLFVSGQWMRIVPTSWEVFPNAVSAALQYAALDWPTENGWVNYNGLQQLAYFTTVFIAAPLAVATGVRMSGLWPDRATRLSRIYPVEIARALHFPVMLYFVAFLIVHVALVLATGALRNLNHMFGGSDVVNWVGLAVFAGSLAVIAAGWIAARPVVLGQIARAFGRVSNR